MTNTHDFGAWLRQLRSARDLTQENLAEAVGCAAETVRSFENGRRRPSRAMAARLADKLQVPPEEREAFIRLARALDAPPEAPAPEPQRPRVTARAWAQPHVHLPPDALIGRGPELVQLRRTLLDEGRRLVTVLGPGGIGKTRLALQLAADLAGEFDDQAVFVALAPISTGSHAVNTIAEAVGCMIPPGRRPEDAVIDFLRERAMLLTLDNLEHLLGPQHGEQLGALLSGILREAPGVHVLVTSRERLKLRGEWVVELNALSLPGPEPTAAVERSEAVLLFLDRARQVSGHFALTPGNRQAVARICRLVGGVPLAIELAATWVRTLTCEEIAAEISRSLDFLAQGDRDLPPRHQSLRAVMEHSWQLLEPAERLLLMRLSVFRGGCRREAVEAVAKSESPAALLALLASLVDKSLLRRAVDSDGVTRYDLHELVRQYAASELSDSPAEAETVARHAAYYAGWVAQQDRPLKSAGQKAAVRALTREIDNIRAAWQWACEHHDFTQLYQMLLTLDWFYELRGWHAEAVAAFAQAHAVLRADATRNDAPSELQICFWLLVGREGWHMLRYDPARASRQMQEAVDQLRAVNKRGAHMHCIKGLAYLKIFTGDYAGADQLLDEALELALASGEPWQHSVVMVVRGVLEVLRSEPAAAGRHLHAALATARAGGDPRHVALTLNYLGVTALSLGQIDEAEQAGRECLMIAADSQDRFQMSLAMQTQGRVALARSDAAAATWLFDEALALAREIGDRWLEAQSLAYLGELAVHQGNPALAGTRLRAALSAAAAVPLPFALDALAALARFALESQPEPALAALAYVRRHPLTRPEARASAEACWQRAELPQEQLAAAERMAASLAREHPASFLRLFEAHPGTER